MAFASAKCCETRSGLSLRGTLDTMPDMIMPDREHNCLPARAKLLSETCLRGCPQCCSAAPYKQEHSETELVYSLTLSLQE